MSNLIFSLNATIPVFLLMLLGLFFRKIGLFDAEFITKMNKFVFVAALPALLFIDIGTADFYAAWDTKYVLFCFASTFISIVVAFFISLAYKKTVSQGEFIQASYRSSAAIIGMAFIKNIYGNYGMASLMIIGTVPLYNIMAVIVLAAFKKGQKNTLSKELIKKTVLNILKNPIILGIAAGCIWSLLKIPMPIIMYKTLSGVAALATPLGLMAMGGALKFNAINNNIKPILICSVIKLLVFCALFLPIAIHLGFVQSKLTAALVMLGSATTVSSYIMAKNMGHDGILTAGTVIITTVCSAFTLTFWLFVLRTYGLI